MTAVSDVSLTMWASWTTAGATLLLGLFAYLAWQASTKSLKIMRESAQEQVEDQNWGRQVEALANYTAALTDLMAIPGMMKIDGIPAPTRDPRFTSFTTARGTDEVRNLLARIESAGLIWRMHHVRTSELIRNLEFLEEQFMILASAAIRGQDDWSKVQEAAAYVRDSAEAWQDAPNLREKTAARAEEWRQIILNTNPTEESTTTGKDSA